MRGAGFGLGAFEALDLEGHGPAAARRAREPGARPLLAAMAEMGWTGRASGGGFYDWGGEAPRAREGLDAVLEVLRPPAALSEGEALERVLLAMVAEGARALAEGAVARASDVDLAAVEGCGMPRALGGPMWRARAAGGSGGLKAARDRMAGWAGADPVFAAPDGMDRLVREGLGWDGLRP